METWSALTQGANTLVLPDLIAMTLKAAATNTNTTATIRAHRGGRLRCHSRQSTGFASSVQAGQLKGRYGSRGTLVTEDPLATRRSRRADLRTTARVQT